MTSPQESYLIPLTRGQVALVDAENYERINAHKWFAKWNPHTRSFYAYRNGPTIDGRREFIAMGREILGLEKGDGKKVDHEDHNMLDNRRGNLRVATQNQNMHNRGKNRNNKSGFKGVHWHPECRKWRAVIRYNGEQYRLGLFSKAEDAHAAYCAAAARLHKEFARAA